MEGDFPMGVGFPTTLQESNGGGIPNGGGISQWGLGNPQGLEKILRKERELFYDMSQPQNESNS